jgi:hypothetical protein
MTSVTTTTTFSAVEPPLVLDTGYLLVGVRATGYKDHHQQKHNKSSEYCGDRASNKSQPAKEH